MSNVKPKQQKSGLPALLREKLERKTVELIDAELSGIHPQYRDAMRVVIRWLVGEDIMRDAAGNEAEVQRLAGTVTAFARLPDDELGLRTRWHVLHIAQEVTMRRSQEIDRAQTWLTPRSAYTNQNPPKPSKRPAPTLQRVV